MIGRWLGGNLLCPLFPFLLGCLPPSIDDGVLLTDPGQGRGFEVLVVSALDLGALGIFGVAATRAARWMLGPLVGGGLPAILNWLGRRRRACRAGRARPHPAP
eukprot:4741373-Pyramimonas_sp.AAC.1